METPGDPQTQAEGHEASLHSSGPNTSPGLARRAVGVACPKHRRLPGLHRAAGLREGPGNRTAAHGAKSKVVRLVLCPDTMT